MMKVVNAKPMHHACITYSCSAGCSSSLVANLGDSYRTDKPYALLLKLVTILACAAAKLVQASSLCSELKTLQDVYWTHMI